MIYFLKSMPLKKWLHKMIFIIILLIVSHGPFFPGFGKEIQVP